MLAKTACVYKNVQKCRISTAFGRLTNRRPHYPSSSSQMATSLILQLVHHRTNSVASTHQYDFRYLATAYLLMLLTLSW